MRCGFRPFQPQPGTAIAYAGDTVRVGVQRGSDSLELRFTLPPSNFFTLDASEASRRWWGFPSVFDTDIQLTPKQCGGPVIDKSGRVIGIAIACKPIRVHDTAYSLSEKGSSFHPTGTFDPINFAGASFLA